MNFPTIVQTQNYCNDYSTQTNHIQFSSRNHLHGSAVFDSLIFYECVVVLHRTTDQDGHTQSPIQCVSGAFSPLIERGGVCN